MTVLKPKINYEVGEVYDFTVNTLHRDFCELLDATGFRVYLKHTRNLNLTKGQTISCRVTANRLARPKIELVDASAFANDKSKVTPEAVEEILRTIDNDNLLAGFPELLLMSEVEDRTFESDCRHWVKSLVDKQKDLTAVRKLCTTFMEETEFLSLCNATERETYQQRLTFIIDYLGYYIKAFQLLEEDKASEFVDQLLDKLDKAGYVYHPTEQFSVFSCLLLADRTLMEKNISRLFDVIRRWPVEIWNRDPFRDALIKALDLYVDENFWKVDTLSDNAGLVRNLTQAISILVLLADNKDNHDPALPDERLALSRLCVLSTYSEQFNNKEVLGVAMNSLLGQYYYRPRYELTETVGNTVGILLKRSPAAAKVWPVDTTSRFIDGPRRLEVSPEGITVYSGSPKAKPVLPEQLALWGNLQVYADRRTMPSLQGELTVKDCKRLWEAIGQDLFTDEAPADRAQQKPRTMVAPVHVVGDKVIINVTSVDEDADDNRAWCTIEGEDNVSGYLYGQDIVTYIHNISLWMFQHDDGTPLALEAVIIDEDEDGMLHFSMQEGIKEFACGRFQPGDQVVCSIGVARKAGQIRTGLPAITAEGESVSLMGKLDEAVHRGDLVLATYVGKSDGDYHISCDIKEPDDGQKIDMARAFHTLMENYAFEDEEEEETEKEEEDNASTVDDTDEASDRLLDSSYVKEIIRIVDRMASIDADYVRSYNYIGFARTLCQLIGWTERADYYRGRMQVIELLYDFAVNDTVDTTQLDRLQNEGEGLFSTDTPLHEKLEQLRIISFMGNQAHDDDLMRFRDNTQGLTRQMASLAMAYNILLENNMKQQANDILNHVKSTLRLGGYESHLKIYGGGVESQTVEFKTSIVYPPDNNSYPDMNRQMKTILTVIASFLNTDGGTLYIGANDSGAGVGVYDDLCYGEFNGDRDKYQRTVLDSVAIAWGNGVASFVSANWDKDEESGKEVLVVTVQPCARGVELGDEWFYRNGSGNRHLTKAEFEQYNERRKRRLAAGQNTFGAATETAKDEEPVRMNGGSVLPATATVTPSGDSIKTSSRRKNVLKDYEEGFVPYEACLKFLPNGKFCKITDYDYDDTTLLTLPVYEDDVNNGYLLLGYEDGSVGKVPVREVMKFEDYKEYQRNDASPLLFAAIATDEDGMVSITREDKTGKRTMVRVDKVERIEWGRMADKGVRLYNEGIAEKALAYEIAPAAELSHVKTLLDRDVRTLGFPLATIAGDIKEWLAKWGVAAENFS